MNETASGIRHMMGTCPTCGGKYWERRIDKVRRAWFEWEVAKFERDNPLDYIGRKGYYVFVKDLRERCR